MVRNSHGVCIRRKCGYGESWTGSVTKIGGGPLPGLVRGCFSVAKPLWQLTLNKGKEGADNRKNYGHYKHVQDTHESYCQTNALEAGAEGGRDTNRRPHCERSTPDRKSVKGRSNRLDDRELSLGDHPLPYQGG